jgi:dTDP-glucose 4,6-dehydratase
MSLKKIFLITGGSGFIGSAVVRNLLRFKENLVINIDKLTYGQPFKDLEKYKIFKNYFFFKLDINNNKINKILIKFMPDYIINLAAETHVDKSIIGSKKFIYSNILGTYNLLECCRNTLKKKFVFVQVSTDEVYGDLKNSNKIFYENSPYDPSSPYSASKASSDHLVKSWFKTYKFPACITNSSNNFGPYQVPDKLIPLTIMSCIRNKKIPIYGNGKQQRNWIYVDDNADAIIKVAKFGKPGDNYNIGSKNVLRNINLVRYICKKMDKFYPGKNSYLKLITYVKDRPGHDFKYDINSNKIRKEIKWNEKNNFDKNIEKTILWYISNSSYFNKYLIKKNR